MVLESGAADVQLSPASEGAAIDLAAQQVFSVRRNHSRTTKPLSKVDRTTCRLLVVVSSASAVRWDNVRCTKADVRGV